MHQYGIGAVQSFEFAEKYYLKASTQSERSFLPVHVQLWLIAVQRGVARALGVLSEGGGRALIFAAAALLCCAAAGCWAAAVRGF